MAGHPKALWIPEGGSNEAGVAGAALIADHVLTAYPQVQHVVMEVGTGGTFAGLVRGLRVRAIAHGVRVTKDDSTEARVREWLEEGVGHDTWRLHEDYHWGGYAKCPKDLITFMQELEFRCGLLLEPISLQKRCGQLKHSKRQGRSQAKPLSCTQEGCKGVAVSNCSRGLRRCMTSWAQNKK